QRRRLLLERSQALFGAPRLAHRVALVLEADADVAAQPGVVVDDQDERAGLSRLAGAVEERVQVVAAEPAMPSGRVEGRHEALIGPLPDRALGDAEVLRRLAERQPVGVRAGGAPPRTASRGSCHTGKLPKDAVFYAAAWSSRPKG